MSETTTEARRWTLSRSHPMSTSLDGPKLVLGESVEVLEVPARTPGQPETTIKVIGLSEGEEIELRIPPATAHGRKIGVLLVSGPGIVSVRREEKSPR